MGFLVAGGAPQVSAEAGSTTPRAAAPTLPEPLTRETVRELVARLSDAEVRALLLAQLDKATAGSPASLGDGSRATVQGFQADTERLRDRLVAVLVAASELPRTPGVVVDRLTEGRPRSHLLLVTLAFAGMLGAGWVVERLYLHLVRTPRRRLEEVQGLATDVVAQAGPFLVRVVVDLFGLLLFVLTVVAVFFALWQGHVPTRQLLAAYLWATLLVRLAALAGRLVLAPGHARVRLVALDELTARRMHAGLVGLAGLAAFGWVTGGLLELLRLPEDVVIAFLTLVRVVFVAGLLRLIWGSRTAIGTLIQGPAPGPLRRMAGDFWPVVATGYAILVLLLVTVEQLSGRSLRSLAGVGSLLVVVALPLVDTLLCRLLAGALGRRAAGPAGAATDSRGAYEPVLRRGIHIIVSVVGLLLVGGLWGLDLFELTARGVGERLARSVVDIAVTLLLAHLAWALIRTAIDLRLARVAGPETAPAPGDEGGTGASRLRTVLPLVRLVLLVTICAMAVMIVLSALGVNIGPLLAGAGVVGLAIGFGTQTLVRDVVTGAFFLADDAFRLGEYVDTGQVKGTVEKISFRSMQLRHHRGALHTIPYGEIKRLTNESRHWVIEKVEFRVPYDTDMVKVKKILKGIGQELMEDPELGPHILEPLKSQGITAMEDSAMVVRAKFMARPTDQRYVIRREAYTRIQKAFAEAGIKFAHRQVTVVGAPAGPGTASAAAAAVDARSPGTA